MAFCTSCGTTVADQARFCTSCGKPLAVPPNPPQVTPPSPPPLGPVIVPDPPPSLPPMPATQDGLLYTIQGDNLQVVRIKLKPGQELYAEAGKMVYKTPSVIWETRMSGASI